MADLDDFFAKKDKKKSKVKKFTASELLSSSKFQQGGDVAAGVPKKQPPPPPAPVKQVEEPIQDQQGIDAENPPPVIRSKPVVEPVEEEWGEFEQEKERDYSGLKIQKLQIQDYEEDDGDDGEEHELDAEGERIKKEPAGPWNKINTQPTPNTAKKQEVAPVQVLPNTAGGVYIPPSMRNKPAGGGGSGSSSATSRTRGKKDKGAPDLANEDYFPTLSAASAIEQNNIKLKKFEQTERGFTEAKPSRSHSNRMAAGAHSEEGPRLNLGNKFNALANEDS